MRILLLFVFVAVFCIRAEAQFNDTINYFVKYTSAGVLNKTNERNSYVFNNGLRFSFNRKNISVNTSNNWIYGRQQRQLSNNDFVSSLDFDLFKTHKHIYYWGLVHYEKSFSLKIDNRFQGGIGLGYYVVDRHNFTVQVSDGILYENSDLYSQEGLANQDYETMRNSLRIKFHVLIKNRVTIDGTDFIQHSFSDRSDYIIRSNTNVSVKLRKWLSFTVAVAYNKLNLTNRENFLLNYGLTFERYF